MPITDKNSYDNIDYRQLTPEEIPDSLLATFSRYQVTDHVLAYVNGRLIQKEDHFIESWGEKKLIETSRYLRDCTERGGIVLGAFQDSACIGFVSIEPNRFGSYQQYRELTFCHVTSQLRGQGIGKQLFNRSCALARQSGIKSLYLSTHPAVETQAFYQAMGCVLAEEVNPEILAREPLDIQLEKHL